MIARYLVRRTVRRALSRIFYQLETNWWATVALYAVMFAIVLAANYF